MPETRASATANRQRDATLISMNDAARAFGHGGAERRPAGRSAHEQSKPEVTQARPTSSVEQDQARTFRDAMGLFATGVTVITTRLGDEIHGMTANGFMSVSLDPRLIVVSISKRARMCEILATSAIYGVSVLAADQKRLSAHFAGRPIEDAIVPFVDFAGVPVIEGALTRVGAHVVSAHEAGDHVLFIGEVLEVELDPGDPLIFHGGAYRALEAPVEIVSHWTNQTDWM